MANAMIAGAIDKHLKSSRGMSLEQRESFLLSLLRSSKGPLSESTNDSGLRRAMYNIRDRENILSPEKLETRKLMVGRGVVPNRGVYYELFIGEALRHKDYEFLQHILNHSRFTEVGLADWRKEDVIEQVTTDRDITDDLKEKIIKLTKEHLSED